MPDRPGSDTLRELAADLAAEHESLDALVAGLDDAGWDRPTPAEGWSVRDQISHLAAVDGWTAQAAGDPAAFTAWMASLRADADEVVNEPVRAARGMPGAEVLAWWRTERGRLSGVLAGIDPAARVPWFGPPMSVPSLVTARLMETWAHGEDVAAALGVARLPTARLRHVAHLGVRTRGYAYAMRGLAPPAGDVRVELDGPGGEGWVWGDEAAADRVRGPVLDFCLVVTRRRHPDDTALAAEGAGAAEWLTIAQAFAGPAGKDPVRRA